MNDTTKLFVYGTLRSGFKHQAYAYISKYFMLVGEARVRGLLYDLGEYPAAVPTLHEAYIKGELYELKEAGDFDWAIAQLDDYEGINPEEGETPLFVRKTTVVLYDNQSTQAWIYWYNQPITAQPLITSGDYIDTANLNKQ
jgi:gamma-glutamylcyclotransferase (GGCT)/AIG2-like uncharacterized protein YtfP